MFQQGGNVKPPGGDHPFHLLLEIRREPESILTQFQDASYSFRFHFGCKPGIFLRMSFHPLLYRVRSFGRSFFFSFHGKSFLGLKKAKISALPVKKEMHNINLLNRLHFPYLLFWLIRFTITFSMVSFSSVRLSAIIRVSATRVLSAMRLVPSSL